MDYITYNGEKAKKTKYDGYYATKSGKILSVKVKGGQGRLDYNNPREHYYKLDKDGYYEVCLSIMENGKHKRIYRKNHRVVWETFNGDIMNDLTIDHIDMNKTNNKLDNLRLLTREENVSIANKGRSPVFKGKSLDTIRTKFKVFINGQEKGIYDRENIYKTFNLIKYDVDQYYYKNKLTKRMKNNNITLKRM